MANRNTIELRLEVKDDGSVVIKKFAGQGAKDLQRLEKSSVSMTKKMGAGLAQLRKHWLAYTAAMVGAVYIAQRVIRDSIKAASDLEEVQNKFDVVFRDQIDLAERWAETLRESYIMSEREAKQYLSSVQDLLVPMGMASDEAGKLALEIVKLAADLGSFNNLPTAQVMENIQSALTGEYESMKKYGVILNATTVQERALAMGLAKTKGELTASQKALAAYEIMMEDSAAAIGDVARSSGSYANQLKQLHANIEDLHVILGESLLPVATDIIIKMNEWIRANEDLIKQRVPEYMHAIGEAAQFVGESIGWWLSPTKRTEDWLVRQISDLETKLRDLENEEITIHFVGMGEVKLPDWFGGDNAEKIEEVRQQITLLKGELEALWISQGKIVKAGVAAPGPAAPPPAARPPRTLIDTKAQKEADKALKAYESLYAQHVDRIKELTLEERDYKLWALEQWYQESTAVYEKAGKDTTALTQLYMLERAEIERQYREEQAAKRQEFVDQWTETEKAITRDLMTEKERRQAAVVEEFEIRMAQLDLFLQKGIITEEAYTAAVQQAAQAREKILREIEEEYKTHADYIAELNKQTLLNMQEGLSDLLFNTIKGNFDSFGDWFESFMDTIYRLWTDTLAKMAMQKLFGENLEGGGWMDQLFGGGGGGGGGGGWLGNLLGGLIGGLFWRGGVFNRGRVHPFGMGTIVTAPTIFPMANGDYGLMGEKDWEGIFPLARTPKGELGVKAVDSGGRGVVINGPLVQQNITTPDVSSFNASQGQIARDAASTLQRWLARNG